VKKSVLKFGFLSGAASAVMMLATVPFLDRIGFDNGVFVGYAAIVASFLFVFFGIRSYRDKQLGGSISFGRALAAGLLMTVISSLCYVVTWEFVYFKLTPDFGQTYSDYAIEKARTRGASADEIANTERQMAELKVMLDQPLLNAAFSFIEPFPVGVLMTLVSAAALKRR
jgi:Protein of unknown function (DUF4199)